MILKSNSIVSQLNTINHQSIDRKYASCFIIIDKRNNFALQRIESFSDPSYRRNS